MSGDQEQNQDQAHEGPSSQVSRRNVLATGAVALAGLALGGASAQVRTPAQPATGRANPRGRFAGKVVLITGATSGIGRTTAAEFAREGARVYFCGRRENLGAEVQAEIRAFGGDATYQRADVRQEEDVRNLVEGCLSRYGRLDIAFNNAGVFPSRPAPLHETDTQEMLNAFMTNTMGEYFAMKYELPVMLRQGGGVIVNMASVSGHIALATIAPYTTSKHGTMGLSKIAAIEYAPRNIRINSISPGAVDTPMLARGLQIFGVTPEQAAQDYPIKRIVTPYEIARSVMFLASDDATEIVGMDLDVTGGYLAG